MRSYLKLTPTFDDCRVDVKAPKQPWSSAAASSALSCCPCAHSLPFSLFLMSYSKKCFPQVVSHPLSTAWHILRYRSRTFGWSPAAQLPLFLYLHSLSHFFLWSFWRAEQQKLFPIFHRVRCSRLAGETSRSQPATRGLSCSPSAACQGLSSKLGWHHILQTLCPILQSWPFILPCWSQAN